MAHHHHDENITGSRLIITMLLNFLITIVEIIGGIVSGSLSLISDALHNFSDGIAVIISYFALKLKNKPNSYKHTFGFKRAEILAALINSSALLAISFYLFYESIVRLLNPTEVQGGLMTIVAARFGCKYCRNTFAEKGRFFKYEYKSGLFTLAQ